ncbi:MAG: sulfite oxidase [Pseudorhodoplanes sp.]
MTARIPDSAAPPRTPLEFPGKSGLIKLGDRPLVAETPESLLDDDTTPTARFYIRNNGRIPEPTADPDNWTLVIDGEVETPLRLTLAELKARFETVTRRLVMECGGNGRSFYRPPVPGNQWTNGGVGCAEWTGVRVADVLRMAKLKSSAVFSGHYGGDATGPRGDAMSRGVPIAKLMDESNLIAWAINGEPLPLIHGFPLRLVIPGWPASVSSKWLTRIWIRDRVHDGRGMGGLYYRMPRTPIAPGGDFDPADFEIIESMPVRSIITSPANGARFARGTREIALRGAAWAGDYRVESVALSFDRGATWREAVLAPQRNPHDWFRWTCRLTLPSDGYFELWSRATDSRGIAQPFEPNNWNPQGYAGNPVHRIAITVGA